MLDKPLYIVEFADAISKFEKDMLHPNMPTVDLDVAKWYILAIFETPNPLMHLDRTANDLSTKDWLFEKGFFVDTTATRAKIEEQMLRAHVYNSIRDLGISMYNQLKETGLIYSGKERYKINNIPINDETYIFEPA